MRIGAGFFTEKYHGPADPSLEGRAKKVDSRS